MKLKTALTLSTALLGIVAYADDCDYVGRHYKADIVPVAIKVANVPRQGDLAAYQSLQVQLKNIGTEPVDGPVAAGIIPARRLGISVSVKVPSPRPYLPIAHPYRGSLRVPLSAGASIWTGFTLPAGTVVNCATVNVSIDTFHDVGQHGCEVFGNDSRSFARLQIEGAPLCLGKDDIIKPHPTPFPHP